MTRQELQDWLGKASREFITHKMNTLDSMTPKKREFMIKVIHHHHQLLSRQDNEGHHPRGHQKVASRFDTLAFLIATATRFLLTENPDPTIRNIRAQ
jgi:predicted metal-dependent hydrolase